MAMPGTVLLLAVVAAGSVALLLSGCGGDGPRAPQHAMDRVIGSADTLLVSDLLVSTEFGEIRIRSNCAGTVCGFSGPGPKAEDVSLSDLTDRSGADWPAASKKPRGIPLAREVSFGTADGLAGAGDAWAGWLDHSLFIVGHASFADAGHGSDRLAVSFSVGDATGPDPVRGSATWSGVMVGVDMAGSRFGTVRGDADITIGDFAARKLDVAFTGIRDVDTGRRRNDMRWHDVSMSGGGFAAGTDGNSINGRFYGPGHGEAGGIFERDQVVGAFGAKRR